MTRPVVNAENSGDRSYVGTWVAECIIHKSVGAFISSFRDQQHLMEKLKKNRAKMKMYTILQLFWFIDATIALLIQY
jgi:hypothetical protein